MVNQTKKVKRTVEYSFVIPVFNEEGNIEALDSEIKSSISKISKSYEIIYINDGSRDNSFNELKLLKNVKIINLNRNYGQATALDAGFKIAEGEYVISLDGDGQNDPADFKKLIEKLKKENLDVVTGWRKNRKDSNGFRVLTRIGRFMRKIIINDQVHDTGCTLRVYRKEAVKSLDLQGEMHRYILALLRWKGFKVGELEVNHRPRIHGTSAYGYSKAIRGFIDLVYISFIQKYSQRPLHIFGYISVASFFLGVFSGFLSIYQKIFFNLSLNRSGWFFLSIFFILGAIMFFSFGIVMDLMIRVYLNTSPYEKRYYIREIIEK